MWVMYICMGAYKHNAVVIVKFQPLLWLLCNTFHYNKPLYFVPCWNEVKVTFSVGLVEQKINIIFRLMHLNYGLSKYLKQTNNLSCQAVLARESEGKSMHLLGVFKAVPIFEQECDLGKQESLSG